MVGISHRIIIASESPLICELFCSRLESNQGLPAGGRHQKDQIRHEGLHRRVCARRGQADRVGRPGGEFVHENRFDLVPEATMMTATEISGNVKEANSDSNGSPASAGLAASFDPAGGLLKLGPLGKDVVINRNGYGELVAS